MSFLDPPELLPPSATIALIAAASSTTTSSITTIGLYQSLVLQVTGTWKGAVVVEGRIDGLDWAQLPIEGGRGSGSPFGGGTTTGIVTMSQIGASGIYYVNVAGMTTFRVRALPTLGSVTVNAKLLASSVPKPTPKRVNNRVAESYGTAIAAGATTTIFNGIDVSAYPMIAFAFVSETPAGGWQTQLKYAPSFNRNLGGGTGNGSPEAAITAIDTTIGRFQSEYIFNRAEYATIQIKNFAAGSHTYDCWILGIS